MINELKPYFLPQSAMKDKNGSTNTSKNSAKRIHTNTVQTTSNYETLLSSAYSKSTSKLTKQSGNLNCDKFYIQQLQQQLSEMKNKVDYLTKENKKLKAQQDQNLNKMKSQYIQLTKYNQIMKLIQSLKLENISLKQNIQSIQRDIAIQFIPLKQIINQFLTEPKSQIIDILLFQQQEFKKQINLEHNKAQLLSTERGEFQNQCFVYEETIDKLLKQISDKKQQ